MGLILCSGGKKRGLSGSRTDLTAAGSVRHALFIEKAAMLRRGAIRGLEGSVVRQLKKSLARSGRVGSSGNGRRATACRVAVSEAQVEAMRRLSCYCLINRGPLLLRRGRQAVLRGRSGRFPAPYYGRNYARGGNGVAGWSAGL